MHRILVGYDGSPSAHRALERAAALWRDGDRVTVIAVASGADTAAAEPELDAATAYFAERGIAAEALAAAGNPAAAICRAAADDGSDTVIVGRRNLSGIRRLLLGSVSERVAKTAPCSVLIAT